MTTPYVELTIPSLYGDGTPIPEENVTEATRAVAASFTDLFGGATVTDGTGYYKHDDGRLAVEDVRIVKALAFDGVPVETVRHVAGYLANRFQQETVLLNISGAGEVI